MIAVILKMCCASMFFLGLKTCFYVCGAYHKVQWSFLQQTLRMKGFYNEWRALIHSFISGESVAIQVNDDVGKYFQTKKGLRQGDPLSPMLFNIVADMLAVMIECANFDGQIEGVIPHLFAGDYPFFNTLMIHFF